MNGKILKKKTKYASEPLEMEVVEDFLPPPEEPVLNGVPTPERGNETTRTRPTVAALWFNFDPLNPDL